MPASATPALAIPASRFVVPPCKPLVGLLPCRSASAAAAAAQLHSRVKVPVGTWVHVAARFEGHDVATFIGGKLVASTEGSRRPGSREEFTVSMFFCMFCFPSGTSKQQQQQ